MKKLVCLLIILIMYIPYTANASPIPHNNKLIQATINTFLDNELESIKLKTPTDSSSLLKNVKLKKYSKLKNTYFNLWYKKLNFRLLRYNLNTNFESLNVDKDTATAKVSTNFSLVFSNSPNIAQKGSDYYYFTLNKINSKWLISNVVSQEDISEKQNIDNNINFLTSDLLNMDKNIKSYKEKQKTQLHSNTIINARREAAIAYAEKWWNSRNPSYTDYNDEDCTNFVSQCIYAGGYSTDNSWYPNSVSWINVVSFYDHMTENSKYGYDENYLVCNLGDIVQLKPSNGSRYNHSVIITKIDSNGNLYYCAHSNNRQDYALSNAYPSSYYSSVRAIGFSYLN